MLVLARWVRESVHLGGDITVTVLHVRGDQVRLRISTPQYVGMYREEIISELSRAASCALLPPEATVEGVRPNSKPRADHEAS